MTTPDNTATTWRDLADQLTPEQVARYERLEQETQGRMPAHMLLDLVRREVTGRVADMIYNDLPAPAAAISVDTWEPHVDFGWSRSVLWREFRDSKMYVDIDGWQQCDGTVVVRSISPYIGDNPTFSSAQARRLAALLIEAADELDRLQ